MNHSNQTHYFYPNFLSDSVSLWLKILCLDLCALRASAVKLLRIALGVLCAFVVNRICIGFSLNLLLAPCVCTFGGLLPFIRRTGISGGHTGTSRCIRAISALSAEPTAMQKCQFSGFSRASRPPFQRENCNLCNLCNICNCYNLLITELG